MCSRRGDVGKNVGRVGEKAGDLNPCNHVLPCKCAITRGAEWGTQWLR